MQIMPRMGRLSLNLIVAASLIPATAQTVTPAPSPAAPAPQPARTKAIPIDPDSTGGMRDSRASIFVTVRSKGKPVAGAAVTATNPDFSVAASCETDPAGHCHLNVGAGEYVFTATSEAGTSRLATSFDNRGGTIVLDLKK